MMEPILRKKNIPSMEHFYASISYGGTVIWKLIPRMKEEYAKIIEERKKGEFLSIEDVQIRAKVNSTTIDKMRSLHILDGMSESNQLSLFD